MKKSNNTTNKTLNINIKKLSKKAVIPSYANSGDAGMDLTATSINETDQYIEYGTGLALEIPTGYVGLVFSRSSVSKYDLDLANAVGVIDSTYRGEIKLRFKKQYNSKKNFYLLDTVHNWFGIKDITFTKHDDYKTYKVGDQIGQLIILPYPQVSFTQVDELSDTTRGEGGFGSTTPEDVK